MTEKIKFGSVMEAKAAAAADKLSAVYRRVTERGVEVFVVTKHGTGTFTAEAWDAK